jgi:hypothetical protein
MLNLLTLSLSFSFESNSLFFFLKENCIHSSPYNSPDLGLPVAMKIQCFSLGGLVVIAPMEAHAGSKTKWGLQNVHHVQLQKNSVFGLDDEEDGNLKGRCRWYST